MNHDFEDKTVIITGASEGVGAATARRFAAEGANLVLVARTRRNLEAMAEELRGQARVLIVPMDVTDPDACQNLFKKALFEFHAVHVLVNNAGYHSRGAVENMPVEELGRMLDVNLKAPILLSRMAIPYIREAGGGAIINVASLSGRIPVPGAATYSASKFGLRAFTFALGAELDGSGIKLAAVSPGPIDTGFLMSNIDSVTDLTFSQPISTAAQVADEIFKLCINDKRERSMPPASGLLTYVGYLFPAISRLLQPLMKAKGARVKKRLKAELRAKAEAGGR
ncbi:MAG: SDR family oxidoreductase [Gammaproteobacteria bacterium]|nr:SDR family oxidoreductase [Gammaproteobacteria bacterium]MDH4254291.1 SDR family oxidoreductase [Gammaproteobacteria bacterium]MDH5309144.1 SDR family oxidoreductase [Gammaproteobacteria bacterium]